MAGKNYNKLKEILRDLDRIAIAVSGGLDSMFLAYTAKEVLGDRMLAITISTPYMHGSELEDVLELTAAKEIPLEVLTLEIPEAIRNNPENRCYLCKTTLFKEIIKLPTLPEQVLRICTRPGWRRHRVQSREQLPVPLGLDDE